MFQLTTDSSATTPTASMHDIGILIEAVNREALSPSPDITAFRRYMNQLKANQSCEAYAEYNLALAVCYFMQADFQEKDRRARRLAPSTGGCNPLLATGWQHWQQYLTCRGTKCHGDTEIENQMRSVCEPYLNGAKAAHEGRLRAA